MSQTGTKKKQVLFLFLSGIFVCNALLAELVGVKIFSLEKVLQFPAAQLNIFGVGPLDFNLTAGVLIWPVVFLSTDVINEYFGRQGVRKVSVLTAGLIAYAFLVIYLAISLAPADFWVHIHAQGAKGEPFDINFAFGRIFGQGLGIIIGSLVAFLIGQFLDVLIFQRLRRFTGSKKVWLRATGSTLISQLIDSFLVLFLAFYLLAESSLRWPISQVFAVAIVNYLYKFFVALLLTPLIYLSHWIIDQYLGKTLSETLKEEASISSRGGFF